MATAMLWASAGPDSLVFELGGAIWRFDPASRRAEEVPIRVAGDFPEAQPRYVKGASFVESFDLAFDGSRAVFGARGEVFTLPAKHGEPRNVSKAPDHREHSVTWSPDGRWLAYQKTAGTRNSSLWVHSLGEQRNYRLTDGTAADREPVFDPEGRYLYFLSDRDFNLGFSTYGFNWPFNNATRIYATPLRADQPPLFPQKSDEVGVGERADAKTNTEESKTEKPVSVRIDAQGFSARVQPLKAPPGNYSRLQANAAGVFVLSRGDRNGDAILQTLALEDGDELKKVADKIEDYVLSANGKKLLLRRHEQFAIVDAAPAADFDKGKLALDRWEIRIEPRREWRQMFVDAWRILRDWFYDPGMHGQDWNAIRARYEVLLPYVNTRADFDYLLTEIAGEANAGHVYVESGDQRKVERRAGGLLGAEMEAHESGYFRVARVLPQDASDVTARSPLAEHGVNVTDGEFILGVDGVDARSVRNFYQLLENKADRMVTLRVNRRPAEQGARDVRVKTIASEQNLRYTDWVQQRRALVDKLSGGRVGYIHVPNTAVEGSRELLKGMVAYADKPALIIDDRYNAGNYWKARGREVQGTPILHHRGPKAMLINGYSGSGGDALPYYFRKVGLGPLVGTRTWGGLIGISGSPRLADNGALLAATFRFMDTDGKWAVENEGVAPDIEVIDRPELIAAGRDPSVEKAVELLLEALERTPRTLPSAPPAPSEFPPRVE